MKAKKGSNSYRSKVSCESNFIYKISSYYHKGGREKYGKLFFWQRAIAKVKVRQK